MLCGDRNKPASRHNKAQMRRTGQVTFHQMLRLSKSGQHRASNFRYFRTAFMLRKSHLSLPGRTQDDSLA
jgi:hypothetical protein